jgi:hypothetical protein
MSFSVSRIAMPTPKKTDLLKPQLEEKLISLNQQLISVQETYKTLYGEEFKFKNSSIQTQIPNIAQMTLASISCAPTPSNMSPMLGASPSPASTYYYPQEYLAAQAQAQAFYFQAQMQAQAYAQSQIPPPQTESKPESVSETQPVSEPKPDTSVSSSDSPTASSVSPSSDSRQVKNYADAVSSSPIVVKDEKNKEKEFLEKVFNFLKIKGQLFIADLGQSSNGLEKPEGLKLKPLLSSDDRFLVDGDKVSIKNEIQFVYTGIVYAKPLNGNHLFMSFEAEKNAEHKQLFKDQCEWLKDQKKQGLKSESASAFKVVNGVKFGQNLIAYRNMSDRDIFDSLKINEEVQFYIQKDGLKSSAVDLIRA